MSIRSITARAPATVANLICGYDTLSLAIRGLSDEVTLTPNDISEWRITGIENGGTIPLEPDRNTCTVVMEHMRKQLGKTETYDVHIKKGYRAGSGLGSSAASAVAALWAYNAMLDFPLGRMEIIPLAMEGEAFVSGSPIADNVAAASLGGMVLVRSAMDFDFVQLPVPEVVVGCLFPEVEIITKEAREILPKQISMENSVKQGANLAGFVSSLYSGDVELMKRSMVDYLVEPYRSSLIPHFDEVKNVALESGAICFGISGSGPSVFFFSENEEQAGIIADSVIHTWNAKNINCSKYIGPVNRQGVQVLEPAADL